MIRKVTIIMRNKSCCSFLRNIDFHFEKFEQSGGVIILKNTLNSSHLTSTRKIMFLPALDLGRALDPISELGRLIWLWLAGHWIPNVFSSFETQTTRLIARHFGHLILSPIFAMFLFPSFFNCSVLFFLALLVNFHELEFRWFAYSLAFQQPCSNKCKIFFPDVDLIWKEFVLQQANLDDKTISSYLSAT